MNVRRMVGCSEKVGISSLSRKVVISRLRRRREQEGR